MFHGLWQSSGLSRQPDTALTPTHPNSEQDLTTRGVTKRTATDSATEKDQGHLNNLNNIADSANPPSHGQQPDHLNVLTTSMRNPVNDLMSRQPLATENPLLHRLAFVELHQETNSFTRQPTTWREFENLRFATGQDVWDFADEFKAQAYGFREAVAKVGQGAFEILPIYCAWACSGGAIEKSVYQTLKDLAVKGLSEAGALSGIYVSLHGAMGVAGLRDPESDFLRAIRQLFGPDFPVAVSFDLHANVTQANVELASFIVGYHTNPHRDFRRTGYKAGEVLIKTVRKEVQPTMAWCKMPLIKGGGLGIDLLPPMRSIISRMKQMERQPGVLIAANFWVHIWMDDPELGWSTVVTTDNNPALATTLAEELADRNWAVRDYDHPEPTPVTEAIDIAKKAWINRLFGTCTFCDVSDIVGAGAPGGNTNILKALYEQAPELRAYVPVRDPIAALEVFQASPDQVSMTISVGGRIDPDFNPVVDFEGEVILRAQTQFGKTCILRHKGIHLLLTELAFPGYFASDYAKLGLNLWKADIVVVKNLFPFRFRLATYNRRTVNVVTNGITNIDVHTLPYKQIPRPVYPLDNLDTWR